MQAWLAVALGGMVGAVLRYAVSTTASRMFGHGFPYGTLIVNVAGSFAMGVLIASLALFWSVSQEARLFLAVGLLGSFTTFSTFSLDVHTLFERQHYGALALYTIGSFSLSILGLVLGLALVRRMIGG